MVLAGFNRTFMELKYKTKCVNKHLNNSFNRTFMELKCIQTVLQSPSLRF